MYQTAVGARNSGPRSHAAHLVVDVSGHGFGHLAQVAPVLNVLRERRATLRVTLRTNLPRQLWGPLLWPEVEAAAPAPEPLLHMRSAVDVRIEPSLRDYRRELRDWPGRLATETGRLRALRADMLLANVPALSLAAARAAGVPAVALSSLNWVDVLAAYAPGATDILEPMRAVYAQADCFIQVCPALPMTWLDARRRVGPVARVGCRQPDALRARCGVAPGIGVGLLAMGGIPTELDFQRWPRHPRWHWLVPRALRGARRDASAIEDLGLPFADVLASCDLVVSKPGYGTFVEAACSARPVIYTARPDWPEEPALGQWLQRHTRALVLPRAQVFAGDLLDAAEMLLARPAGPAARPTGNAEAAALLETMLDRLPG